MHCNKDRPEFVCLCEWPLSQYLCANCAKTASSHNSTSKSPHHKVKISLAGALTEKSDFDRVLSLMDKYKKMEGELKEMEGRAQSMEEECIGMFEMANSRTANFHHEQQEKMRLYREQLSAVVSNSISEVGKMIFSPTYKSTNQATLSCWNYVNGSTTSLELNIKPPEGVLQQYRQLDVATDRSKLTKLQFSIKQSRSIIAATKSMQQEEEKKQQNLTKAIATSEDYLDKFHTATVEAECEIQFLKEGLTMARRELGAVLQKNRVMKKRKFANLVTNVKWTGSVIGKALVLYFCNCGIGIAQYLGFGDQVEGCAKVDTCSMTGPEGAAANRVRIATINGVGGETTFLLSWLMYWKLYFCHLCLLAQEASFENSSEEKELTEP